MAAVPGWNAQRVQVVQVEEQGKAGEGRLIVPVMMSGRSGSSVIAHAVQELDVDFGDRLRRPKAKNPKGFFEDRDVRAVSKRLHRLLGGRARLGLVADERWQDPALRELEQETAALLARRFASRPRWGFKNGRILRYLPFWLAVLQQLQGQRRFVFAVRNPLAAAQSRDRTRAGKWMDRGGGVAINLYQWLVEVLPYFHLLRDQPLLLVDFDRLAAEPLPQLKRIASFLDLPWSPARETAAERFAGSFLSQGLRHHQHDLQQLEADPRVPRLAVDSFRWLNALAADRVSPDDPALWEGWASLREQLLELGPLLDFAGATEQALWQAQLDPLSPLRLLLRSLRRSGE